MDAAISEAVNQCLKCAPQAVAATKKLLWDARFKHSDEMVAMAADLFTDAVLGAEGIEGTKAFLEKRKPRWMPEE